MFMNFLIASSLFWSPLEIMKFKALSDVQVAPDNRTVAYVVTESDLENNAYVKSIYKNKTLFREGASHPRWSPNGEWLAFVSKKNLWVIPANGGEAKEIAVGPVQTFRWSPDSQHIAFIKQDEASTDGVRIYGHNLPVNRLWLADMAGSEPNVLTPSQYCVRGGGDFGSGNEEFDWSPDGKTIVFSYAPTSGLDHHHLDGNLASLDVTTGLITQWEKKGALEATPRFSPDGKWVAYVTSDGDATYFYDRYVAVRAFDGTGYQRLGSTYNEGSLFAGPNLLGWNQEGTHVLFFEPKGTQFHIALLPLDGGEPSEMAMDTYFDNPALSFDRSTLGFVVQSSTTPPEAFIAKVETFKPEQRSEINTVPVHLPKTEVISWKSEDGFEIEGLLTYPIGYEEGKKYPLLLVIHGGPMGFFRDTFIGMPYAYPYLSFAESGFIILRPNPRGSTGYGKEFRSGNKGDWGGKDYLDLMNGVDHLIAQGIVDPNRMGVMGWSYGGYMSAWTVTQTSRFKAASIGAACLNLVSLSGTTDLHRLLPDYLGEFWENHPFYVNRSPIHFVAKVETPCLIQHGIKDLRVPISQAHEFHHALEKQGKESVFLIYPDTSHYFEKPLMELDSMQSNLQWFKNLLLGKEAIKTHS